MANSQPHRQKPRLGPRPLPLHLCSASLLWLNWPLVWMQLKPDSDNLNKLPRVLTSPKLLQRQRALQEAAASLPPEKLAAALQAEACHRFGKFISAIKNYRQHPARRMLPDMPVLWQLGTTRLLDYAPQLSPTAPQLLVIPSLINRYHVLDLDAERSFLRWLAAQGIRPLLVDWDAPGTTEKNFTLSDYVLRLCALLDWLTEAKGSIHILGYCLGGILATAVAQLRPQLTASLIAFASPWDFHAADPTIADRAKNLLQLLAPLLASGHEFPVDGLQALLTGMQPLQVLEKFRQFPQLAPTEQRQFVLLEDWLNDGVPLTAPAAHDLFQHFYGDNAVVRKNWQVSGQTIDSTKIMVKSLVIAPGRDRIVPPASTHALAAGLPHATLYEPALGHIGMVVSKEAPTLVWPKVSDWILSFRQ
jgi:polyhydroxyalkanoate synthase subunit PhaC